jgi:Flp pilus assembly protein TadG
MEPTPLTPREDHHDERGSVMVIAALAITALLLFAALALDVGMAYSSRTQSQNADDSAALAAASKMIYQDPATSNAAVVRTDLAIAEAKKFAGDNGTVGTGSVQLRDPTDFAFGEWNTTTHTLDTSVGTADPDKVTGVQVNVAMDNSAGANKRSPTFLSQLLGISGFQVQNQATAYLGFQGSFGTNFNLPIAIDSCQLSGNNNGCGDDFCAKSQQPTSCTLFKPQSDSVGLICGDFQNTTNQDICWTAFSNTDPSINKSAIQSIVDAGQAPTGITAGTAVYLDNGDKTSSLSYLRDKMYGCGSFKTPAGVESYGEGYAADSWVVKLPVVQCQNTNHCAGGTPMTITGGVCFEIREIVNPAPGKGCNAPVNGGDKIIRGRALCPNSSNATVRQLYHDHCLPPASAPESGPGGCNFGLRAQIPVLVK